MNNVNEISIKVNSFFTNLKENNCIQTPSILYTYGKHFNIFGNEKDIIVDINTILNDINDSKNEFKNIIILDSSFNPPTVAHIKLLTETFSFYCEKLLSGNINNNEFSNPNFLLLITNNNVDKKLVGANLSQRLQMMEIVSNNLHKEIIKIANEKFQSLKNQLNNINILVGLTNVGRFIDKVIALKQYIPKAKPAFIMGYDTITRFFMEKYYIGLNMKEVLDGFFLESNIICADRIMYNESNKDNTKDNNELNHFITEGPAKSYQNKIFILNNWLNDNVICKVSSSEARNILKENYNDQEKLQVFLPKEIISFILYENLYI
ncbi:Nucleotidylyl transferase [Neocallimastix lanati (nom. inval.)]|jgi:nicotinamide-nucleotide adenylyltransferase|uniref:Nucleotidylyl transferase n=1 Tax=Neocallimastix californiae TaxID=1754190 RepID=A0A1Y2D9I0_9FUNG|nr:Nucleotidylyl transferase [Neocallimastix sp. JGI-2020a]ORY55776.1 Nucleotidylyl transferase [Neocallimastix californiae]|eukprot:ORY55776.1 Nucleotidylyl transferase [Neocallimastix californiae]